MLIVIVSAMLLSSSLSKGELENEIEEEVGENYDDIHDLMTHIVKMYENPSISTHSQLRDAAMVYINKLLLLKWAVRNGTSEAISLVQDLYKKGTYQELMAAPFSKLVGHYGWNMYECQELESITFKANDIWKYFLREIIRVTEPSIPEHRVFNL